MIRMIRTKNLKALREGAELASVLEKDLESAESTAESYRLDLSTQDEKNGRLEEELDEVRTELAATEIRSSDLATLANLLFETTADAFRAAEAPVEVVLRDGQLQSLHRERQAAQDSTPFSTWKATPEGADPVEGWHIRTAHLPRLETPAAAPAIEMLLKRVERPAPERIAEADRVLALRRDLENVRSQRDLAMADCFTAASALTAESLAHALHRAAVADVAAKIAHALSASDPTGSIVDVGALLLRYADVLCIDPHGPGLAGETSTETKGAVA